MLPGAGTHGTAPAMAPGPAFPAQTLSVRIALLPVHVAMLGYVLQALTVLQGSSIVLDSDAKNVAYQYMRRVVHHILIEQQCPP